MNSFLSANVLYNTINKNDIINNNYLLGKKYNLI